MNRVAFRFAYTLWIYYESIFKLLYPTIPYVYTCFRKTKTTNGNSSKKNKKATIKIKTSAGSSVNKKM